MTAPAPRLAHQLNRALRTLLAEDTGLFLLGEDIADPYGGAFKITNGLSSAFPERVRTTPISEAGIVGVANGLALTGHRVIVEIMFADFVTLAFDQIVNFAAKSVTMYGHNVPMPVIIRCPTGGGRGYGPTHSQSPQKFFLGVPDLDCYELSLFHSPEEVLRTALNAGHPALIFEPKTLYPLRVLTGGQSTDGLRQEMLGGSTGWALTCPADRTAPDVVVIAAGGCHPIAAEAAARARESGITVHLLTPALLYPFRLTDVLPVLRSTGRVVIVDEGTAGPGWGTALAHEVTTALWTELAHPPLVAASRNSVIPAAPHLEQSVLVRAGDVLDAVMHSHHTRTGS